MTTEMIEVINVAPIFNFIYNLLALLGALTLVFAVIFLTYSHKNIGMLLDKYPLVSENFINKGLREQNVENNQEIHEQNERLDAIEEILTKALLMKSNIYTREVGSDN